MAWFRCGGGEEISFTSYESISGQKDDATVSSICDSRSTFSVDVEVEYSIKVTYGSSSSAAYAELYCGDELIWKRDKFGGSVTANGTCILPAGKIMSLVAYRTGSSSLSASCEFIYGYNNN